MELTRDQMEKRIKWALWLFVVGLVLSGLSVFPLVAEVDWLNHWMGGNTAFGTQFPELGQWVTQVNRALVYTNQEYPFIFYGTDWLGFAHLMIAVVFIGPLRDPVRNVWVIEFGMIACVLVVPFAFLCAPWREIPIFWTLADCSFGIIGILPLWYARSLVTRLEALPQAQMWELSIPWQS